MGASSNGHHPNPRRLRTINDPEATISKRRLHCRLYDDCLDIADARGHSTIQMTMRYAHLAPEIARDAVKLLDRTVAA